MSLKTEITEDSPDSVFKMIPTLGLTGGPVVKESPSNAGDMGLILGRGAKIPHASRQLSPCNTVKDPI